MPQHGVGELQAKIGAALLVALFMFIPLAVGSQSPYRELAQSTLIVFLSTVGAAWAAISLRRTRDPLNALLFSGFTFQAVVRLARDAELLLLSESSLRIGTVQYLLAESTDVYLMIGMLSVGTALHRKQLSLQSVVVVIIVASSLPVAAYHFVVYSFPVWLDGPTINMTLLALGLVSLFLTFLTILASLKAPVETCPVDRYWMVAGLLLLGAAAVILVHDIGSTMSLYGLSFRGAGLLVLVLAVSVRIQTSEGIGTMDSHLVPVLSGMMAIVPYTVILAVEGLGFGVTFPNLGAFQLIHAMMTGLCMIMALLIYLYSQKIPTLVLYPVAAIFVFWSFVHAVVFALSYGAFMAVIGENLTPYMAGGAVSVLFLLRTIYWTRKGLTSRIETDPTRWALNSLGLLTFLFALAIIVEQIVIAHSGDEFDGAARVVLLVMSLFSTGAVVPLSYLIVRQKRTWRSLEGLASAFIVVLVIPLILKSVYQDYTVGWWSAELVGLFGLLLMPAIVGVLYVEALTRATESERFANLYSDLLMHDISNMHQAVLLSLSLFDVDGIPKHSFEMAVDDARRSLARAVEIVSNVRSISSSRGGRGRSLGRVDLKHALEVAHQHVCLQAPTDRVDFSMEVPEGECAVKADELLSDLFYNIIINAVKYSKPATEVSKPFVRVLVNRRWQRGKPCWETQVIDNGRGIEPGTKQRLFRRFMDGAHEVGLGLAVAYSLTMSYGGTISVEDRVAGDYTQGTVFIVVLPEVSSRSEQ